MLVHKEDLGKRLFHAGYKTGVFRLRSGTTSNEYFDKYAVLSDVSLADDVAMLLADKILFDNGSFVKLPEYFGFLEMGAIPLAVPLIQHYQIVDSPKILFIRKKAKQHGTCRDVEGDYSSLQGKKVVLIEDVITTGGAVIKASTSLRMLGATVTDVYCIVDREAENSLEANGIKLHALFTMAQLKKLGGKECKE